MIPVNVKHRRLVNFTLPRLFTVYPPAGLQFTSIEGGDAEPPWAPQTDLRSLLIRRMTSKPHKTIFWPIPTSPSLCYSVSVPQILISANCINFYSPFTREMDILNTTSQASNITMKTKFAYISWHVFQD